MAAAFTAGTCDSDIALLTTSELTRVNAARRELQSWSQEALIQLIKHWSLEELSSMERAGVREIDQRLEDCVRQALEI